MYYIIFLINLYLYLPCDSKIIPRNPSEKLIVGGQPAGRHRFPFTVALYFKDQFTCTASIISPNAVLTAGHCVVRSNGAKRKIESFYGVANVNRSAPEVRIYFNSSIVHPNYRSTAEFIENDMAVMITTTDITFGGENAVKPICLARQNFTLPERAIELGWGKRNSRDKNFPEHLRYIYADVIDNSNCLLEEKDKDRVCTKGEEFNTGACYGDSGGPLISTEDTPVQFGVTSYIVILGNCGQSPTVYSAVSEYNDFIKEAAKNGSICFK